MQKREPGSWRWAVVPVLLIVFMGFVFVRARSTLVDAESLSYDAVVEHATNNVELTQEVFYDRVGRYATTLAELQGEMRRADAERAPEDRHFAGLLDFEKLRAQVVVESVPGGYQVEAMAAGKRRRCRLQERAPPGESWRCEGSGVSLPEPGPADLVPRVSLSLF